MAQKILTKNGQALMINGQAVMVNASETSGGGKIKLWSHTFTEDCTLTPTILTVSPEINLNNYDEIIISGLFYGDSLAENPGHMYLNGTKVQETIPYFARKNGSYIAFKALIDIVPSPDRRAAVTKFMYASPHKSSAMDYINETTISNKGAIRNTITTIGFESSGSNTADIKASSFIEIYGVKYGV